MPKVSVIVTAYNVEKYIRTCIASIQSQTIKDIEIIVVDDGTPDNSMNVVEEIARNDDRIRIIRHEKNMGLMWARKTGYMAANGVYIAFCDSDDYLPENSLELLLNEAEKTQADIVSGDFIYVKVDGHQVICQNELKYGNDKISVFKSLLKGELKHTIWGKLYRASILKDYPYTTYKHFINGEDGCLFYQIVENIDLLVQIDKPVYYYMQNMQSSTQVRYKEDAIKSICINNMTKDNIVSKYPELKKDLHKSITNILCSLYAQGYDKDAKLDDYIREYGLSNYVTLSSMIKNCKWSNLVRLVKRRALL